MTNMIERVARAMQEAVIRDDEGEFPRLFDLLDFSGENKAVTVVHGLAEAAIKAMRDLEEEAFNRCSKEIGGWADPFQAKLVWQAMIGAALNPNIEE